ncbi:MAG: hypothetical protein AAE983_01815 [Thermoplasmataceae archaeon]|jgi:hypothetical protein
MKKLNILISMAVLSLIVMSSGVSLAATPAPSPLPTPPSTLPSFNYYVTGTPSNYTITSSDWSLFFSDVLGNSSVFTGYNWSANATEALVVFDTSYTGLNYYGLQLVSALSEMNAAPTAQNFTKAFVKIEKNKSLVKYGGVTLTNLRALELGAFPGFTWSHPRVNPLSVDYRDAAIIIAIVVSMVVLYFVFNRRK